MTKVRVVEDKKPVRVPVKDKNSMLTYEELGIPPIHEFDYENYDKVLFSLFRIGADIVAQDIQVTLQKALGVLRHYVLSITLIGIHQNS